ncbi:hypothetical protein FRB91_011798 [Serendipita sp. 411]|nr:hypothetical protein FRB91_011798 [Serendipita sp. 411]
MEDNNRTEANPVYELCPLISQLHSSPVGSHGKVSISCIQALGSDIYIGCSNGTLLRYVLNETEDGTYQYTPISEFMLQTRASIEDIQLAPSLSMALVLSDGCIFFLSLPTLALVPPEIIRPMKNAIAFAINETSGPQEPVGLALIKRDGIGFWELGAKLVHVQEFKESSIILARRSGPCLCLADTENYIVFNLSTRLHLPFHPISTSENWKILPQIAVSNPGEFLVVACMGTSPDFRNVYTMGIFVNENGDPCQDPINWESPPTSIAVDEDLIASLHIDGPSGEVVEIRRKGATDIIQSIALLKSPDQARLLSFARRGFAVPVTSRLDKLRISSMSLFEPLDSSRKGGTRDHLHEPDSGLTPPPTPKTPSNNSRHSHRRSQSGGKQGLTSSQIGRSLPTARLLVATSQSVYALLPSNLISQVEQLLDKGKVKDAAGFLSQAQAKHGKNETLAADFQYLNTRIGVEYLHQTAFEDAGDALFRGGLDPRLLIGLWDDWRELARRLSYAYGTNPDEPIRVEVFSGLEKQMVTLMGLTIETIVTNYSPHLKPSTSISSAGKELRASLHWNAKKMLKKYLRKFCNRRRFLQDGANGIYSDEGVNRIVDTVLVILYAESKDPEDNNELSMLLDASQILRIEDIRDVLISNGHIASLIRLYERSGDTQSVIEIYVQLVEGQLTEFSILDPLERVKRLLQASTSRDIVQKYILWLLRKDRTSGIELMISSDAKHPRSIPEDILLLSKIQEVDSDASLVFLEYLVLQKQTLDPSLHTQLVLRYLDALLVSLQDPKRLDQQKETIENYRITQNRSSSSTTEPPPFLWYLAFDTPMSEDKTTRLKLDFMLQGSSKYDMEAVRRRLRIAGRGIDKMLALEMAILEAKCGNHKSTLSILVNDLQDFLTAEAYCAMGGGRVITPKLAVVIGDRLNLSHWAAQVLALEKDLPHSIRRQGSGSNTPNFMDINESHNTQQSTELTRMLLEVYMGVGQAKAKEASMLLNAQAVKLDAEEITQLMPSSWSLDLVSSFFERSFRRSLHASYEGQILKQLSAAQNLQTSALAFEVFAAAGAMIEEPNDDDAPPTDDSAPTPPPKTEEKGESEGGDEKAMEKSEVSSNEGDIQPSTSYGAKKEWSSVTRPNEHSITLKENI